MLLIEHKSLYFTRGEVPDGDYTIPFGVADIKRAGDDVTIIATSWMVLQALAAAESLAAEGISCEVIDPRTLWPLDKQTLVDSVQRTRNCVVVTEAPAEGRLERRGSLRHSRALLRGVAGAGTPRLRHAHRHPLRHRA